MGGFGSKPAEDPAATRLSQSDGRNAAMEQQTTDSTFWGARTNLALALPESQQAEEDPPEGLKARETTPLVPKPTPRHLIERWYTPFVESTPKVLAVDLLFVALMFVWSVATPTNEFPLGHYFIAALTSAAILVALIVTLYRGSPTWCFVALAIAFGSLLGHSYYCSHFIQVWSYDNKAGYIGVHAASPANSKSDAGSFAFTKTTHVDVTQPIGYKRGDVYCVAPIVDDSINDATVNFWAVGLNCCGARDAFRCYDSLDPRARGGMVVAAERESDFHSDPLEMYKKAAEIASARYDLKQSPNVMFVYWMYDLAGERTKIATEAYYRFIYAGLIFLAILLPTFGFFKMAYKHANRNLAKKNFA